MNCIIPGGNMKIISKAVHTLAKIGDELYLEAKKDCLQLAAINLNKTVYTTFNFNNMFFTSYNVEDFEANTGDAQTVTCKIHMKAMLGVFKFKGPRDKEKKIEFCKIELEGDANKIVFKIKYKQEITIVHSLRLIDSEFAVVSYSKQNPTNQICSGGHFFAQILGNFQLSDDDLSLELTRNKLTAKNYDTAANAIRCIRSQVILNSNEFNIYRIDEETNITLSFKPFRAAVQFSEAFNLNLVLNVETGGKPAILLIKSSTFEVDFVLATINPENATQSSTTHAPSLTKVATPKRTERLNLSSQDHDVLKSFNWDDDFEADEYRVGGKRQKNNELASVGVTSKCGVNGVSKRTNLSKCADFDDRPEPSQYGRNINVIFARCFETTFRPSAVDLNDVLAPNSDSDSDV